MHVLKKMVLALSAITSAASAIDVPKEFAKYREWLENAPYEEKHEHFHDLSEKYIEKFGEDANKIRLCINLDQNWMGMDTWVDQRWRQTGIRLLDNQRYNDWIVNADWGTKPWVVMFAYTPYTQSGLVQPTDNMMRNLACLATVYGDTFNFGLMDHRASEKVYENYDIELDYGKTTPALVIFDSGRVYPAQPNSLSA